MSSALVVLIVIALVLAAIGVGVYLSQIYNSLVTLRHDVDKAWSNIDVLLRQRYDEVRELVQAIRAAGGETGPAPEIADRFLADKAGLMDVSEQADATRFDAEQQISASASRLLDLAAHLPAQQSNERLHRVQERILALEQQIRHRREYYNQLITISNARCEQFPDRLLATRAGLRPRPLFAAVGEARFAISAAWDGQSVEVLASYPFQGRSRPTSRSG
jgi:LemA protein